jgi:competence protein ComEA
MRTGVQCAAAAIALFLACAVGTAQYQDRDTPGAPSTSANAPPPEERIDINHATQRELMKVPGMTSSWAGRIVRFRPYNSKVDLLNRGIVSAVVYDRIRDFVIAHRN